MEIVNIERKSNNQITEHNQKIIQTDKGLKIYVNASVLITQSRYFKALFRYDPRQCIHISEVDSDSMKQLLLYLEKGDVEQVENNFLNLLETADYLMLDGIIKNFQRTMCKEINPWNCIAFFNAALRVAHLEVFSLCQTFILFHFESVVKYADIGNLALEDLKRFLTDKDLNVDCEDTVWEAIVLWVEGDKVERVPRVPSLVRCIRLEACSEECIQKIMSHPYILRNEISNIMASHTFNGNEMNISQNFINCVRCFSPESLSLGPRQHVFCSFYYEPGDSNRCSPSQISMLSSEEMIISKIPGINECIWTAFNCNDQRIYAYNADKREFSCYMLLRASWVTLPPACQTAGHITCISLIDNRMYALFIHPSASIMVSCFTPEFNHWEECLPPYPVSAETLGLNENVHSAQVRFDFNAGFMFSVHHENQEAFGVLYDFDSNLWKEFQIPNVHSEEAVFIAFEETVFKFHMQRTEVERYFPVEDAWRNVQDLSYVYQDPVVQVRKDTMFVFERETQDELDRHPIYWDSDSEGWLDGSSLFYSPINYIIGDADVVRKYHSQRMKQEWESMCKKVNETT